MGSCQISTYFWFSNGSKIGPQFSFIKGLLSLFSAASDERECEKQPDFFFLIRVHAFKFPLFRSPSASQRSVQSEVLGAPGIVAPTGNEARIA